MACKTILLEEWDTRRKSNLSNQEMDHCTNEIVARLRLFARSFLACLYFFFTAYWSSLPVHFVIMACINLSSVGAEKIRSGGETD